MLRPMLLATALLMPAHLIAADSVKATNSYIVNSEEISAGADVFWKEDNYGTFAVQEGPIDSGFVRCVGSGFGGAGGVNGGGVCVFGEGRDTFTMRWEVVRRGFNTWTIVTATGKYSGMTGSGTTKTRVTSSFLKASHRISDWEGEIKLRGQD